MASDVEAQQVPVVWGVDAARPGVVVTTLEWQGGLEPMPDPLFTWPRQICGLPPEPDDAWGLPPAEPEEDGQLVPDHTR